MKVVVVTGVSGAGKSTALRALEDLGFYCADNLPMPLLPKFIELLADREEVARAALVVDARSGDFLDDAGPILSAVRAAGHSIEVLFLDAPDGVLIRRFSETRRRHPLSGNNVQEGLLAERELGEALVIDVLGQHAGGVANGDVVPAPRVQRVPAVGVPPLRDVDPVAPTVADFADGIGVDVARRDDIADAGQTQRHGATDARAGAGDQRRRHSTICP